MWAGFVELLRASIFSAAHVCGGSLGAGILIVSAAVRLALLPLTLRLARAARAQQIKMGALAPEIAEIKRRYADDLGAQGREIQALYAKNGIKMLTPSGIIGLLVQAPVFSGLYSAVRGGLGARVRFLWVGDLARPDTALLLGVAALTAWGMSVAPQTPGQNVNQTGLMIAAIGATMLFFWSASSAAMLSIGANSLVTVLQNWILSREAKVTRLGA